jgi:hypothetical protein
MKVTARCQYLNAVAACLAVVSVGAPATRAQQQPPTAKDLSAVIEMLRSPDPVVRVSVACARDVFNSSATAAIPALIDLLNGAGGAMSTRLRPARRLPGHWFASARHRSTRSSRLSETGEQPLDEMPRGRSERSTINALSRR